MPTVNRLALFLLLLITLAPASALAGDDPKDLIKEGKALLKEGDDLADKGQPNEAVIRYKRAFEKLLPAMRKLPFTSEVKRDVTKRVDMKAMLLKEFDADMTPQEFRAGELGMKALGLLPPTFNLKDTMVQVYSEEIAAFYDPKTKTMHLIEEPEEVAKKPLSFLEKLMGKTQGFDKDGNKTVIAHEMTHALDDQHFDIDKLQKSIKENDDRDLALSALIEGEATLTMMGASAQDWDGAATEKMPAGYLEGMMGLMIPLMPMAGGKSLREAPVILSESMIFPYMRGLVFCARVTNEGGWDALDAAYKKVPLSTEQILHPQKYLTKPDLPTAIDLGTLKPGEGWKEAGRNVVGEMQLAVLLRQNNGKRAAAGWDGDRFAVFEGPEGKLGLVWFTTWDSDDDAEEFADAYTDFQTTKVGTGAERVKARGASVTRNAQGTYYVVDRQGPDVVIIEGFPAKPTSTLTEKVWKAKKTEMTYESVAAKADTAK